MLSQVIQTNSFSFSIAISKGNLSDSILACRGPNLNFQLRSTSKSLRLCPGMRENNLLSLSSKIVMEINQMVSQAAQANFLYFLIENQRKSFTFCRGIPQTHLVALSITSLIESSTFCSRLYVACSFHFQLEANRKSNRVYADMPQINQLSCSIWFL